MNFQLNFLVDCNHLKKMKELTFAFKATATCLESIQVPNSYKTKGKTLDQIYEEVYDKYGIEKDLFYDKYIVGKKEFKKLNIEIEGVHSIQKNKNGKIKFINTIN